MFFQSLIIIAILLLDLRKSTMFWARRLPSLALRHVAPFSRQAAVGTRRYASLTQLAGFPKAGDQLHGFTLKRIEHIPELELTALNLQHDKTGADYLHIARDDSNNVFAIGFKTNPPDATGIPHILEHTTLCGSERSVSDWRHLDALLTKTQRYPVRDPFFKMLPRSLSNFMNAFTSSDHTVYPFSTTNVQDYRNLMSVYLDATLHPLLKESDFTQEGWRIGPENMHSGPEDPPSEASQLVFKGVVYNEMKGQMSDAGYLYYIRFLEHLVPSLNNSGGDPQKITDLTHEQLKKFHKDHYHPSNAKVYTYGNIPLTEHLREINERLNRFDKITVDEDVKSPKGFNSGPQNVTIAGPIDPLVPLDAQHKTSVTWKLGDASDVVERFSMSVLSSLLLDGYGSPMYQSLIESGLGADFTPNTGFSVIGKSAVLSIGLTGVKEADVPRVKKELFDVLERTKATGFDEIKINGILHQLELGLKHKSAHFGRALMQRIEGDWHSGFSPFDSLAWDKTVRAFKERYAQPGYLPGLIEKYLMTDQTMTFTMEPSETYAQDLLDEEKTRLSTKIKDATSQFSSEQEAYQHLAQRERELVKEQEKAAHEDINCLPSVHVEDIPRVKPVKVVRKSKLGKVNVQWRETHTNGLTYFRAFSALKGLPDELRELIPLFSDSIMRLGTKSMDMEQIENLIKLKTGGISVGYHTSTSPRQTSDCEEGLLLTGHAFDQNVPDMLELLRLVIHDTDFDSAESAKMIMQLLQTTASGAIDSIAESGHGYARRYAMAGVTAEGRLQEQVSGLTQVAFTAALAGRKDPSALADVIEKLKMIQQIAISNTENTRVSIHCDAESTGKIDAQLQKFLQSLPSQSILNSTSGASSKYPRNTKTFFPLPYQVYYAGVALPTIPYVDPAGAPLQILSQLLSHKHLHHEIREKGGAYGAGAAMSGLSGTFSFFSYRDPNPQNTMRIIRDVGTWASARKWSAQDIEEAKLSTFQGIDAPESVSREGMTQFLYGVDPEMQQKRREQLLDVTAEQVNEVAEKYLVQGIKEANVAMLGPQKDWIKDSTEGWTTQELKM